MNVIRFSPLRQMETISDRFNRLFEAPFHPTPWFSEESGLRDWRPVVDVYNEGEKVIIKAELPGVDKKDIHVDVKDGTLTLSGERSCTNEAKEENFYRKERAYGKFKRSFALPEGLNPDKIDADYKDGVLKIEIPKPEEKKPKEITVH
ncbi:MAG: Hsp20/alpha crystallin family protein [Thermodesulfobacteriota bacterium]|nr:Hsp20/alpha crystallin family protein [Thermodesulfobacteriota bacterium]